MYPRHVVRVSQSCQFHDIEKEVREVIDGIAALGIHTAHGSGLCNEVATVVLARSLGKQKDMLGGLGREAQCQLESLFPGDSTGIQVFFIVRIEVLVDPSQRHR